MRDERRAQKRRGERVAPAGVTVADVAARNLESPAFLRLAATTRQTYRAALERELLPRFGPVKIGELDADMIGRYVHDTETRAKRNGSNGRPRQSTTENLLKPLRAVCKRAVKEKLISASPFAGLDDDDRPKRDDEPHEPHEWTDDELTLLLAASQTRAQATTARYDYTPLLTVAAKAGLRLGECLGLDWEHVELRNGNGAINVRQQWTRLRKLAPPKAGSRRRVPIADELVAVLRAHRGDRIPRGPVFASRAGGRLSYRNVERRGFDPAARDAGLEGVTFHDLRRAYGSRLASKGLTARQIADAMGHKKTSTTEIYIQRFNGEQADQRVREAMSG